ncbi:hypothetical protein P3X46_015730 [Hevea brasiliensis]|uniref:DUF3741 domain-containing protein n=1 Tax=Hevea brasiliensis TaxID=3981 RepID=A0ABQ9LY87_HEVBR|nr:hypothetical protein P3X46_015730 [Hevea brasiliensis]
MRSASVSFCEGKGSSTITPSLDANMCTSKSAIASCLACILRRLLCPRSLPTHPSDQMKDTTSIRSHIKQQHFINSNATLDSASTAPGIVARLMGLESFPDTMHVSACSLSRTQGNKINWYTLKNEEHEECRSDDSSPVFVLDFNQFMIDPEVPLSGKLLSRLMITITLCEHNEDNNFIGDDHPNSKKREETCRGLRKKVWHAQHYMNKWEKIWKSKDVQHISADFGSQILDQLLEEPLAQLCSPQKNLNS